MGYEYNLGGELTSLTGPSQFGSVKVNYNYDTIGRPTGVTGANYAGVTSYASNITYRAFGMNAATTTTMWADLTALPKKSLLPQK